MTSNGKAYIASLGTSTPPLKIDQKKAGELLTSHYVHKLSRRSIAILLKLFQHPSITSRSFAMDDTETLFTEDPDSRIARFTKWSVKLSAEAVIRALSNAGKGVDDVRALIVNTCTGYICPGISTYLIEELALRRDIQVYDLVGGGCGGALPNLQLARALSVQSPDGVVVSVSVEICSATFQISNDLSLLVSNAIFGDGAAAVVVSRDPAGLELLDFASICVPEEREHIRYVHKNGQLHNQLSMSLDRHIRAAVAQAVTAVLGPNRLQITDLSHWVLHNGGEKIVNMIKEELGLTEEKLASTRRVLAQYGNMSSPTVLFVLQELMKTGMKNGELCMMVAFGAGLSAHACLLRKM